jgi:hypothetical protein
MRRPRLPADDMALAVEVGELTAGEVAAAIAGGRRGERSWGEQGRRKAASGDCRS